MCSLSLDSLSWCPSLVEVLCLVDHSDILHCKLVNQRFRDLIRRNYIIMPRNLLSTLEISEEDGYENDLPRHLRVSFEDAAISIMASITDDGVVFDRWSFEVFKRLFGEKGGFIERATTAVDSWNYITGVSYAVDGMESGLRLLLSIVLRRYHVDRLYVQIHPIGRWGDLLAEQFKRCRSRSRHVELNDVWPNIGKFWRDVGSMRTTINLSGALRNLVTVDGFWNRQISVNLLDDSDLLKDVFEPTIFLIKKWISGNFRVRWVAIRPAKGVVPYEEEFKQKVVDYFEEFQPWATAGETRNFMARRPSDNVVLRFAFSSTSIVLHDYDQSKTFLQNTKESFL